MLCYAMYIMLSTQEFSTVISCATEPDCETAATHADMPCMPYTFVYSTILLVSGKALLLNG